MQVENKIMYHYHKIGLYDDIWKVGNEISIDKNFKSNYCSIIDNFRTGVITNNGNYESFDRIIKHYLKNYNFEELDNLLIKQLLEDSRRIIINMNIYNREVALEKYRKDYYPNLPSRLNSIWLTDDQCLEFWIKKLSLLSNVKLYKVSVTGIIFKSSDSFIPNDELTTLEMYNNSKKYWEPHFENNIEDEKVEYLFQGKVKVLEEIN